MCLQYVKYVDEHQYMCIMSHMILTRSCLIISSGKLFVLNMVVLIVLRLRLTIISFSHKSLYYFIHASIVARGMTMCIHLFLKLPWNFVIILWGISTPTGWVCHYFLQLFVVPEDEPQWLWLIPWCLLCHEVHICGFDWKVLDGFPWNTIHTIMSPSGWIQLFKKKSKTNDTHISLSLRFVLIIKCLHSKLR